MLMLMLEDKNHYMKVLWAQYLEKAKHNSHQEIKVLNRKKEAHMKVKYIHIHTTTLNARNVGVFAYLLTTQHVQQVAMT